MENECYNEIISALTSNKTEIVRAVITHMANFSDTTISDAILKNTALISLATNADNYDAPPYKAVMDQFIKAGYPYKGFVSEYGGSFHRKIITILIKHKITGEFKLIEISGSYNFFARSYMLHLEEIYILTLDWATQESDDYNTMKDYLITSIKKQYPELGERRIVLNKIAQTNSKSSTFSPYNGYSVSCDFYPNDTMLNDVNIYLCKGE